LLLLFYYFFLWKTSENTKKNGSKKRKKTGQEIEYRSFAQALVKRAYKQKIKDPSQGEESIDEVIDEIEKIDRDFQINVYFGKIIVDDAKEYISLMIRTDNAHDLIRSKYFLTMEPVTTRYDDEIDIFEKKMYQEMKDSLFPQDVKEKYEELIESAKQRKEVCILQNPPLKF
jgi:hypothetical protein